MVVMVVMVTFILVTALLFPAENLTKYITHGGYCGVDPLGGIHD